jgi:hypothetical protein
MRSRVRAYDPGRDTDGHAYRVISASTENVYDALTDPEALTEWLPPTGMSGRFEHFAAGLASSLSNLAAYLNR